ncbi:MAG TPA: DUF2752 domain-containing protein [Bacteroidales bacterium]|nr:DUF2752 domain-containing protein [Bacteroidales bacterium]
MILYKKKSKEDQGTVTRIVDESYHIINIVFAGVIVLILAYSGIFSPVKNNYPVVCIHELLTGEPCFSCGLSHSFSLIVRGRIAEAYEWNQYGMRVFLFFISQLIFRLNFLRLSIKHPDNRKHLIIYDSVSSGLIFLISFWPFIVSIFNTFF